mmetsp:Transcript_21560/g.55988  ORF Transcript_21560/g.55988 Transcript_21560/m.55988 type:complete len:242 (-) Transcript_21560:83-808(-)
MITACPPPCLPAYLAPPQFQPAHLRCVWSKLPNAAIPARLRTLRMSDGQSGVKRSGRAGASCVLPLFLPSPSPMQPTERGYRESTLSLAASALRCSSSPPQTAGAPLQAAGFLPPSLCPALPPPFSSSPSPRAALALFSLPPPLLPHHLQQMMMRCDEISTQPRCSAGCAHRRWRRWQRGRGDARLLLLCLSLPHLRVLTSPLHFPPFSAFSPLLLLRFLQLTRRAQSQPVACRFHPPSPA